MSALLKRYKIFLALSCISIALTLLAPDTGWKALSVTKKNTLEMLSFLPPIFVLLGLLDVWIDRETMMKYMGDGSGMRGCLLAFFLGSAAAGPRGSAGGRMPRGPLRAVRRARASRRWRAQRRGRLASAQPTVGRCTRPWSHRSPHPPRSCRPGAACPTGSSSP